jgi:hypothetical protein
MINDQENKHIIKKSPAFTTMEPGIGGTGFGYYEKLEELMMKDVFYHKCSWAIRIFNF